MLQKSFSLQFPGSPAVFKPGDLQFHFKP